MIKPKPKTRNTNQKSVGKTFRQLFKQLKAIAEWIQKNPIPLLVILIAVLLASGAISWQQVQEKLLK